MMIGKGSYTSQGARRRAGLQGVPTDALLETALGVGPAYLKQKISLLESLLVAATASSVATLLFTVVKGK
jgi:hypothetical protein